MFLQVLSYMLVESPAAELKQTLLKSGYGTHVSGRLELDIQQQVFSVALNGVTHTEGEFSQQEENSAALDALGSLFMSKFFTLMFRLHLIFSIETCLPPPVVLIVAIELAVVRRSATSGGERGLLHVDVCSV